MVHSLGNEGQEGPRVGVPPSVWGIICRGREGDNHILRAGTLIPMFHTVFTLGISYIS